MNPSAEEVVTNEISVSVSNKQPETDQYAGNTKKANSVRVSRSRSKSVSRSRSNSPPLRTFSRSPVRHPHRSISPRRRSISPNRSQNRSRSPARSNLRSRSPIRTNLRSRSPVRHPHRSISPRRRSISPKRSQNRSRSPARSNHRSRSPTRSNCRSRSQARSNYRLRSPARTNYRSRSKVARSISTTHKKKPTNRINERTKSGLWNEQKINLGNGRNSGNMATIGTMKCHKSSRDWLPSHLFPIFASILDTYGHDEHLSDHVSNMEHMFRGVNTKEDAVARMGKEEVLRMLSMYIMTNGKFRNSYNKFKMYKGRW